jgi:hypothetical protein
MEGKNKKKKNKPKKQHGSETPPMRGCEGLPPDDTFDAVDDVGRSQPTALKLLYELSHVLCWYIAVLLQNPACFAQTKRRS